MLYSAHRKMKDMKRNYLSILIILALNVVLWGQEGFVQVNGTNFEINGEPYHYVGANFWFGMNLGDSSSDGDRDRLIAELDALGELGITNLRIMVASEGPNDAPYRVQPALQEAPKQYSNSLLEGIDFLLDELRKRDMKAVLVLNNFFQWTGGMAQYVSWATGEPIPYPHEPPYDWTAYQEFSAEFFRNKKARRWYRSFLKTIVRRTNSINGIRYREDPTIMAWQLANEPRGFSKVEDYVNWVTRTTALIHRLDKNHLVSLGGEGFLIYENIGTAFEELSQLKHLDYLTMHLWVENWQWYQPAEPATFQPALENALTYLDRHLPVANAVNKPLVLEEFGISRDGGDHDPNAATTVRDEYFTHIFEYLFQNAQEGAPIGGANFWSWSGYGLPLRPHEMWEPGDPLTGDPPHELQGWYSIYQQDSSTLGVIQRYVELMSNCCSSSDNSSTAEPSNY